MKYKITDDGHPTEARAEHAGCAVRLVTGFDIVSDQYPIHVYVSRDPLVRGTKVPTNGALFNTRDGALEYGATLAEQAIDTGVAP